MPAQLFLGTQGWNYDAWVGPFYPADSKPRERLSLYARVFNSVEVDSTFYAIPAESSVKGWNERTPETFTFCFKVPSEITHKNRLVDSQSILNEFLERIAGVGTKLGCLLIQMPPDFSPGERDALRQFLKGLPSNIRFAIEFRDPDWISEQTLELLAERHVAPALTDGRWISRELMLKLAVNYPADFAYIRWLGPRELTDYSHVQIDRTAELSKWAAAFEELTARVKCVHGYFNNHFQGHSPASCNQFKKLLGLPVIRPDSLVAQLSLF